MESVYDAVVKEFEVAHDITSATPTLSRMNYRHGDTLLRWYADFEIAGTLSYRIFEVLDVAGRMRGGNLSQARWSKRTTNMTPLSIFTCAKKEVRSLSK